MESRGGGKIFCNDKTKHLCSSRPLFIKVRYKGSIKIFVTARLKARFRARVEARTISYVELISEIYKVLYVHFAQHLLYFFKHSLFEIFQKLCLQ